MQFCIIADKPRGGFESIMGCFAFLVMLLFMHVGVILWHKGSLWGPIFFWTSAAIAGTFSAAFLSLPPQISEDIAPPMPPPELIEEDVSIIEDAPAPQKAPEEG